MAPVWRLWAVIKVAYASHIVNDKSYEQYARRGGFTLNAINSAKAIARKNPAVSKDTVATGMLRPRRRKTSIRSGRSGCWSRNPPDHDRDRTARRHHQ
jgi:hypothetical protein